MLYASSAATPPMKWLMTTRPAPSGRRPLRCENERRRAETREDEWLAARPRERSEDDEQHASVQARPDPMPSHCSR